jgi:signal transduction histidine kinase/DNA-binding response OmpR family regulator
MDTTSQFSLKRFFLLAALVLAAVLATVVLVLGTRYLDVVRAYRQTNALRLEAATLAEFRYDLVQIQQSLTDASATREPQSFQNAEQYLHRAEAQLQLLNERNTGLASDLTPLPAALVAYYETGVRMAHLYMAQGTVAGNALMQHPIYGFDQLSLALIGRTEAIFARVQSDAMRSEAQLDAAIDKLGRLNLLMYAALFAGVLGSCWWIYSRLVSIIGAEPVQARQLLRALARTDADTNNGSIVEVTRSIEQLIAERETALAQAREARAVAESASKAKSTFLANMSHEIRTPMNGVIGMTELALATELTATQRSHLMIVRSSAESLLTIINDILDFSKIEAGKLDIESVAFSLRGCIRDTLTTLGHRASEKNLLLNCVLALEVTDDIMGDPVRVRQILTNLLSNAIKYSERGQVLLSVRIEPAATLHFCVEDHGIGIAGDKLQHIFESFSQADASTTRRFGGTGLGLTICKQLVELMGGRIWVESTVGVGSRFHFTLPEKVAHTAPVGAVTYDLQQLQGKRVLVVEDSLADQRWLVALMNECGLRIDLAESAARTRHLISHHRYDLVLLDIHLPDGSGMELLPWLIDQQPDAAVLVVTAAGTPSDAARCRELGASAFMNKPMGKRELHKAMLRALDDTSATRSVPMLRGAEFINPEARALHIMVAEDNIVNQMLTQALLERLGHSCDMFNDGAAILQAYDGRRCDLILMDMNMPVMGGIEATRAIRAHELHYALARTPIIALTANAMAEAVEECRAAGMDGFVCKPIKFALLASEIERCVSSGTQVRSA